MADFGAVGDRYITVGSATAVFSDKGDGTLRGAGLPTERVARETSIPSLVDTVESTSSLDAIQALNIRTQLDVLTLVGARLGKEGFSNDDPGVQQGSRKTFISLVEQLVASRSAHTGNLVTALVTSYLQAGVDSTSPEVGSRGAFVIAETTEKLSLNHPVQKMLADANKVRVSKGITKAMEGAFEQLGLTRGRATDA